MGRYPTRRVVILNLTDHQPDAVFMSVDLAAKYFNTYISKVYRQITLFPHLPLFGYLWRFAEDWEKENNELLPPNDRVELK